MLFLRASVSYCLAPVLTRRSLTCMVEDQMDKMLEAQRKVDPLATPSFTLGKAPPFDRAMQAKINSLRRERQTHMRQAQLYRKKLRAEVPKRTDVSQVAYLGELCHKHYQDFLQDAGDPAASQRLLIPTDVPCRGGPAIRAYWEYTQ